MNIHEYQAKRVLQDFGIPIPPGEVVETADQAVTVARELGGNLWVLKAQIHAGGRGKGGGVKLARSLEEISTLAQRMIGMQLVTPQTGPEGRRVRHLYVVQGTDIAREFYVSLLVDPCTARLTFVISPEGGIDIEELALRSPEKILSVSIDPLLGFQDFYGRQMSDFMGFQGALARQFQGILKGVYKAFMALDAALIEINPLVLTPENGLVAVDAKMTFDDNGLFRHPQTQELRDIEEEDPLEVEASQFGVNYIKLDGNIACMVNGAGLAMATMDIIKLYGGQPANFLDVGGGASKEQIVQAFKILLADPGVEAILVNIFGGIMRCDLIAQGLIEAVQEVGLRLPLVVRLAGTNVEKGRALLETAGLALETAADLGEAAQKIVAAVRTRKGFI